MIKEWCEECQGNGQRHGVLERKCESCQGKGYTELEPEYYGTERELWALGIDTLFDCACTSKDKVEVYIKEVKEE